MGNIGYRFDDGGCACSIADGRAEGQHFQVLTLSSRSAEIATDIEFQENEYIDISIAQSGEDMQLFAHVITSGSGKLWVRWLHFDPGEQAALATRLEGVYGEATVELPDANPPAPTADRRSGRSGRQRAGKRDGTRRVVKPKGPAASEAPADDAKQADERKSSRRTRKVVRPSHDSRRMAASEAPKPDLKLPEGDDSDDDFIDVFGSVPTEAPKVPTAKISGRKHKTATIEPFGAGADETHGGTRRVVKPRANVSPVADDDEFAPSPQVGGGSGARAVASNNPASGGTDPDDPSGKHVVIAPTARFEQLPDGKPPGEPRKKPASGRAKAQQTGTISQRRNVIGNDGKLDVAASVRSKAKTVRASELAARHDKVRVLNMSTIKELIQDAVQEAVTKLGGSLEESERKKLLQEAEADFQERLKAFKAEKAGAEAQAKNLQDQLKRAEAMLQDERKKSIEADQFTVSEAGMEDLEKRMERLVGRAIKVNGVNDTLANELEGMVSSLLDTERERIAEQAAEAQNQAIVMLEKKVKRLASTLDEVEAERDQHQRRANALEAAGGGGVAGFMTSELGEDPDKERKLELLKDIFAQNQEMRTSLQDRGIKVPQRARRKPKPVAAAAATDDDSASEGGSAADDEAVAATATTTGGTDEAAGAPADSNETAPAAADVDAAASETSDAAGGDEEDPYADMGDPDDEVWEPGMSFSREVAGDNEDEADDDDDRAVKKLTGFKAFAPPPLQRGGGSEESASDTAGDAPVGDAAATSDEASTEDTAEADADDDIINPDDQPWEPGMSFSREVAGDNEDEAADDQAVKKLSNFKSFEPPPLQRKSGG